MKKKRRIVICAFVMTVVFIVVSIVSFLVGNDQIKKGYLRSEGGSAENFAVLTASILKLTDKDVSELKTLSYQELQEHEKNKQLEALMTNASFINKIDYAYVMVHLPEEEVKYQITEDIQDLYNEPVGTNMDILWLLDVSTDKSSAASSDHEDVGRYGCYGEHDDVIFNDAPTYTYIESGWGNHICGYAPLYSVEGTYIGVVGVELQTSDVESYQHMAMWAMAVPMVVSIIVLLAVFVILYSQYQTLQFERIYTDALTQVYNRSYYNNQFIRRMNAERKKAPVFALMIADIDWFKKVNDTFGHEVGDRVLIEMAELLTSFFGKKYVCRFGGEEFVVGIWLEEETEVEKKLEALFKMIRKHRFTAQEIEVTLSLGASYFARKEQLDGWLLSGMLKAADFNLYEMKENGRDNFRVVPFDPEKDYTKKMKPNQ